MEIAVISSETIKPLSPTPLHLQHLKFSLIDQYMGRTVYSHVVLFYSAQGNVHRFCSTNMSDLLKKSLSEVLTKFYPLAGTLNNNDHSIRCNDNGLEYIEARVKAPYTLDQLLSNPQPEELTQLLPYDPWKYGMGMDLQGKMSAVKVTVFDGCGGMAIGVAIAHPLADGSSLATFVKHWAAAIIARGDAPRMPGDNTPSPKFGFASLFPPRDDLTIHRVKLSDCDEAGTLRRPPPQSELVTKRFVFRQTKIQALKAKFHANQFPITRVEAVTALIFKCLINVAKSSSSKSIALILGVNIRTKMSPPLAMHYFGNMALPLIVQHNGSDSLDDLVMQIRRSMKFDGHYVQKLRADNAFLLVETFGQLMNLYTDSDVRVFGLTSLCRFPFYEIDFGWGEPIWAASVYPNASDGVSLIDAVNGSGIEAWVTLHRDDMKIFETDKALHEFTGHVSMKSRI